MPPTPSRTDLVAVKVMGEQEWAFDLHARHVTYREMRRRSSLPRALGGLGYELSEHVLKGLVGGYIERMRETLEESPEVYRLRELGDLDEQYRAAAEMAGAVDRERTMLAAYAEGFDAIEPYLAAGNPPALRDEKTRLAALATLRQINERRAKLLGLDVVQTQKVDVTVTDATDKAIADLAAELKEAGA